MANFSISLRAPAQVLLHSDCPEPTRYSDDLDDVRSILSDLCEVLAEEVGIAFVVEGFDVAPWCTTVRTDLAVALEQLPEALRCLRDGTSAELDFYEQGLQRSLLFEGAGADVTITCTSGLPDWIPKPGTLHLPREVVVSMLTDLARTFLRVAGQACPGLVNHPWLEAWAAEALPQSDPAP